MNDNKQYTFHINGKTAEDVITSLQIGDVFYAKASDNDLINDDKGNFLFKVLNEPVYEDVMGWSVMCEPVSKDEELEYKLDNK